MARFRTLRERRLWIAVTLLVLAIWSGAYFVEFPMLALRSRGLLGPFVWSAFAVCAGALLVVVVRERPRPAELLLLAAAAGAYLLEIRHLHIVQERIHLIEYGVVAWLFYAALCERWREGDAPSLPWWKREPALLAIALATAAGWGDEIVQYFLPNRVYDLGDVALNALAGTLLVTVVAVRRRLRAPRSGVESAAT